MRARQPSRTPLNVPKAAWRPFPRDTCALTPTVMIESGDQPTARAGASTSRPAAPPRPHRAPPTHAAMHTPAPRRAFARARKPWPRRRARAALLPLTVVLLLAGGALLLPAGGWRGDAADAAEAARARGALHARHAVPAALLRALPPAALQPLQAALAGGRRLLVVPLAEAPRAQRWHALGRALAYAAATGRAVLVLWDPAEEGAVPVGGCEQVVVARAGLGEVDVRDWAELGAARVGEAAELDDVARLVGRHVVARPAVLRGGKYGRGGGMDEVARCVGVAEWEGRERGGVERAFGGRFPRLVESGAGEAATARLRLELDSAVNGWVYPGLSEGEVVEMLNGEFSVPRVFLKGMPDRVRRRLLHDLEGSPERRALFVHTQYGLGNRLRAMGSAMALARVSGRVLVTIWEADVHLNCSFRDLFVNDDIIVMDKFEMQWPPTEVRPYDPALSAVDYWNMMRGDGDGGSRVHDPLVVNVDPRQGRHLYVKSAYVIRSTLVPGIVNVTSPYWAQLRDTLTPVVPVATLVADPDLQVVHKYIGVHIRGRTLDNDISGVKKESYGHGAETTDRWRRRTGVSAFADKIRRLPATNRYFVAADQPDAIQKLRDEFGPARIFSLRYSNACDERSVECARLALADILLLARVRTLLGSNWSSFSEAAVRLNGRISLRRILLAGVHFGR